MDTDDRLRVIFVALTNDIGVERVINAMAENGARCALLSPRGSYCASTRSIELHHVLPHHHGMWLGTLFVRSALESAIQHWSPNLVIPLDDVASWQLRGLATSRRSTKQLRSLLHASLGPPEGYLACCRRLELMRVAASLGIETPAYESAEDPDVAIRTAGRWGYPLVLKEEFSCGGHGVTIVQDPEELRRRIENWRGNIGKRLRALGKHVAWSFADLRHACDAPPILQAFVHGRPAMHTVSASNGRVLEGVSFIAERVHPTPTGTSTVVRFIEHQGMQDAAQLIVERLGCSGFTSFDFMIHEASGRAYLIEMNARPIGTSHLGRLFGHDLCEGLVACLHGEMRRPAAPTTRTPKTVAMFPKELERCPDNLQRFLIGDVLHDVPMNDPGLVAAYLSRLAKLYPERIEAIRRILPACYIEGETDVNVPRAVASASDEPALALQHVQGVAGE